MQALVALGQSGQAQRLYRAFAQRFKAELDAAPSEALQRLAAQLGQSGAFTSPLPLPESVPMPQAVAERTSSQAPPPPVVEMDLGMAAPQARLLGNAFLLRTNTRFFGREEEIARLSEMLASPRTRLVTLLGPGGIGKTRLALEVAASLVEMPEADERTPGTAVFVPLADITQASQLFEGILRALDVLPMGELTPLEQLVAALASQPSTLLILDNFEHLVEEGALLVQELLARIASVKLLVTSRQKLDLEGEQSFHLSALPTSEGSQTPDKLLRIAGIALFVDRAQAARPDFQLTERNAVTVARLCARLEGIPLALELAAARVAILAPAKILEQIETNRLDFLATRRRDAASRQRTLRATLDWSYQLLPPTGKAFLMQLAVFRGGWTLEAAEAVCEVKQGETLELLMLLRDCSLIGVVDTEEGLRFTMIETIREYSREKLLATGEEAAAGRRHLIYFLAMAEEAEPHLTGLDQALWLERLEVEQENFQASLEWCRAEADAAEAGLRLAAALWRFWWVRGPWSAARTYLMEALQQTGTAESTPIRAKALCGSGMLANSQSDYTSAAAAFEESLSLYRELGDRRGVAAALNGLGNVAEFRGDHATADRYYEQSLAIYQELDDQGAIAVSLNYRANVASLYGEYDLARRRLEEALVIRRELGDKRGVGEALHDLAAVAKEQGNYREARALYEQSVAIYQELGDRARMVNSRHALGIIAENEDDLALARAIYKEDLGFFQEIGDRNQVAWTLHGLGYLACRQGDFREAHSQLVDSLSMFRDMASTFGILRTLDRLAGLAVAQGQMTRAVRLLGAVKALIDARGVQVAVSEQQENESYETAARSVLGLEAFTQEWETGQAMTLEQAIEYALV
jgi:predicted ATPase